MFLVLWTEDWIDRYKQFNSREKAREFAKSLDENCWAQIVEVK